MDSADTADAADAADPADAADTADSGCAHLEGSGCAGGSAPCAPDDARTETGDDTGAGSFEGSRSAPPRARRSSFSASRPGGFGAPCPVARHPSDADGCPDTVATVQIAVVSRDAEVPAGDRGPRVGVPRTGVPVRPRQRCRGRPGSTYNLDLSQRRAGAVMEGLIRRGVAADRLEAIGSGEAWREGRRPARAVDLLVLTWTPDAAPPPSPARE